MQTTKKIESRLWAMCECGFVAAGMESLKRNGFFKTGRCPDCGKVL